MLNLYYIKIKRVKFFISLRVRKCGFTHASRAEIRIFTPRDIKFRTILVRLRFLDKCDYITRLRLVLQTHTRQKTFHRTRIVMYYFFVEEHVKLDLESRQFMRSQSTEQQKSRHSPTHLICDRCCVLVNSFFLRAIVTNCPVWQLAPVYPNSKNMVRSNIRLCKTKKYCAWWG